MDAPYKCTMCILVLTCLVTAVASSAAPPPANYAWFSLGMILFGGTYYGIVMIVRERLEFYIEMARDSNAKQSIKFLKTGCYIFFGIWVLYPIFWLLGKDAAKLISPELDAILTAVMDVFAKSAYGFALLYFRLYFDKKLVQSGVDAEDFHKFSQEALRKPGRKSSDEHRHKDRYMDNYSDNLSDHHRDEEAGFTGDFRPRHPHMPPPRDPHNRSNPDALQNRIRQSLKKPRPAEPEARSVTRDELMSRSTNSHSNDNQFHFLRQCMAGGRDAPQPPASTPRHQHSFHDNRRYDEPPRPHTTYSRRSSPQAERELGDSTPRGQLHSQGPRRETSQHAYPDEGHSAYDAREQYMPPRRQHNSLPASEHSDSDH